MKISEIFSLHKTQHELDFVDVDPSKDKRVFIDPFFLSTRENEWCLDATRTIKSFFQQAIDLVKAGRKEQARSMFIHLNEPNETCFGFSKRKPQGRGVDLIDSEKIFSSLLKSKAVATGLVEELEDTAIFIDGIDKDKVSDVSTNIIKNNLLDYTQKQCELWGMSLTEDVPTGFFWDVTNRRWTNGYTKRLVVNNRPLLLVPKIAVSFYKEYVPQKYYQHFVLNYLQGEHLNKNTHLVHERKLLDGSVSRRVYKNELSKEVAPYSKEFLTSFTSNHPDIFSEFRIKTSNSVKPISNMQLEDVNLVELIDFLIKRLKSIPSGGDDAHNYHLLMIGILELIFYPNLVTPIKEKEINQGRKRIDISFDNNASNGFFHRLHDIHKIVSGYVYFECKNYSDDPENPELDQLSGRFSVNRSNFGILVCRKIDNTKLFMSRCQDLWKQKKELIIPLTDDKVFEILDHLKAGSTGVEEEYLDQMQREIINS